MTTYLARHLLPVTGAPLERMAIDVEHGQIRNVRRAEQVATDEDARDLGDCVVMPGLVNSHVHVELSWMAAQRPRGGDYVRWLRDLLALREREDRGEAERAADEAIALMVRRGTIAVGDIANGSWAAGRLARAGLAGQTFVEVLGLRVDRAGQVRRDAEALVADIERDLAGSAEPLRVSCTAHAPHTVSAELLRQLKQRCSERNETFSIHVAESREEVALLVEGSGPFAEIWRQRDFVEADWQPPRRSPIALLDDLDLLDPGTVVVHAVQLDDDDHDRLAGSGARVITCPRSNAYLGVGTADVPRMIRGGVTMALGTDSCASAPDLDLFAEMRALLERHPTLTPREAIRMATLNGATVLGLDERLGSVEPGKRAALIVVPFRSDAGIDPEEYVCSEPERVFRLEEAPWTPR